MEIMVLIAPYAFYTSFISCKNMVTIEPPMIIFLKNEPSTSVFSWIYSVFCARQMIQESLVNMKLLIHLGPSTLHTETGFICLWSRFRASTLKLVSYGTGSSETIWRVGFKRLQVAFQLLNWFQCGRVELVQAKKVSKPPCSVDGRLSCRWA